MKAAIIDRYGPAYSFKVKEMPVPQISDQEILVKVKASSVNPVDCKIRKGKLKLVTGTEFPKILGADFSGEVAATGSLINDYKKGDQVYGTVSAAIGGAYSEYIKVKTKNLAPKPEKLNHEEAAGLPLAGLTALQGLRDHGCLKPEQKVLINGASGGVGSFAVQIAKSMGAQVTGVCSSENLQTVNNLGALDVIDYTKEEVLKAAEQYHVIFDTVGNLAFSKARKHLYEGGIMVSTVTSPKTLFQILFSKFGKHKKMKVFLMAPSHEDLLELKQLVDKGALKTLIQTKYSLKELAQAHEHSQTGHARGKIIIAMNNHQA